jgi:hypothetical protein
MSKKVYSSGAAKQAAYRRRLQDDERRQLVKQLVAYYSAHSVVTDSRSDGTEDLWFKRLEEDLMSQDLPQLREALAVLKKNPDRRGGGIDSSGEHREEPSSIESLANATELTDEDGSLNAASEELLHRAVEKLASEDEDKDSLLQQFRAGQSLQWRIDGLSIECVELGEDPIRMPDGTLVGPHLSDEDVVETLTQLRERIHELQSRLEKNTTYFRVLAAMKEVEAADLAAGKEERRLTRAWRKKRTAEVGVARRRQRAASIKEGCTHGTP